MILRKKVYSDDEDCRLMLEAVQGDKIAQGKLYKKYLPIVAGYAAKYSGLNGSSEDIAQEVFIRLYENNANYQPTATLRTYLCAFARNVIYKHKRRQQKQLLELDELSETIPDDRFNPEIAFEKKELAIIIANAKSQLPRKQRQVIELTYWVNLPPGKIATQLRCSKKTVYDNLHKARKNLYKKLTPKSLYGKEI